MIKGRIILIISFMMALLLSNCANMKAPGGGPKDIYGPQVLESDPPNYTVHFHQKRIELKFNEFVDVSDISTEVFISPPLQKSPEIKTRGKSVIIEIDEKLHDSTTYSIFFGKSIKDITEGNPIENYTYVFSTGDKIDSLSVIGEVIEAFNLKPREDVLVMLYEDKSDTIPFDSLPYLVKPSYLTRTNPAGFFVINNLRDGDYRLFALSDNNYSSTYDNAEEQIAFLDSLIAPKYLVPELADSLYTDSITALLPEDSSIVEESQVQAELLYDIGEELLDEMVEDTALMITEVLEAADSLQNDTVEEGFYSLFMFKEVDTIQRLLGVDKPRQRILRFIFRYAAQDVEITPLTAVPDDWMAEEWSEGMDTLRYYILSETIDTISLKISQDTIVFDTASFSLNEEELPQRKKEREAAQILTVNSNTSNPFPYYKKIILSAGYPIAAYDFSRFLLIEETDTLQAEMEIYGSAGRRLRLMNKLKENTRYTLFYPDSVLTDIIGRSNDSTEVLFNTNHYDDYGLYKLHVFNNSAYPQLIIQLMTEEETVIREEIVTEDKIISWDYLDPGKLIIKVIGDINMNAKWDTGRYIVFRQPEPVVYYPKVLDVRSGWKFEEDWIIEFK